MKLPELSEVQFQGFTQSKEFDPLKLPDPNPNFSQNLSIMQQSFANMSATGVMNAPALYKHDVKPSFVEQMAELVPKFAETLIQFQQADVAIQMARADEQFYQMDRAGKLDFNQPYEEAVKGSQQLDDLVKAGAGEAAMNGAGIDTVRGILGFSNHGDIALREKIGVHFFQNHYKEWIEGQRLTNTGTIKVENENGELQEVTINDQDLPIFMDRQVRSHLRTAFLGHPYLADTNNETLRSAFKIGQKIDDQLEAAYDKQYRAATGEKQFTNNAVELMNRITKGDPDALTAFMAAGPSIWDKKGEKPMARPGDVLKRLDTWIKTTAENGATYNNLSTLLTKATFEDGQTFMQRAPEQARSIARNYREARRTYLSDKLKADKQDLVFSIAEFNKESLEQPKTVAEYVEFKGTVRKKAAELGIPEKDLMTLLDHGQAVASMGADEINELRKDAEIALATGNASQSADYYTHPVVGPEVREKVDKQVNRVKSPEYKTGSDEIEARVRAIHKTMVDPQGNLKGEGIQVNAYYQRMYDDQYTQLLEQNETLPEGQKLTPKAIADKARDNTLAQQAKDREDKNHPYYVNPKNGNFDNFPTPALDASETALQKNISGLVSNAKTSQGILTQVAKTPAQLGLTDERTREVLTNYQMFGIIPPELKRQAKLINNSVGRIVITNPMQLAIAAGQGLGILKPGEIPQAPAFLQRAGSQSAANRWTKHIQSIGTDLYTDTRQYGPVAQMPTRAGMPAVMPVFPGGEPQGLQGLTASDFRELAFIVSGEAARGTDDEYAVAASAINRLAGGRHGNTLHEIARRPGQYAAVVTDKTARYEDELIKKLSSPEGQKKIAQMLMVLEGRTDFKGQSQLRNRDPDNDPMFDPRGNFYHYAGQTGMGPYTGTINRNYLRFIR